MRKIIILLILSFALIQPVCAEKDWNKIYDLTREISSLAFDMKIKARAYKMGVTPQGMDIDKTLLLPKIIQIYQNLQTKLDELKVEWAK